MTFTKGQIVYHPTLGKGVVGLVDEKVRVKWAGQKFENCYLPSANVLSELIDKPVKAGKPPVLPPDLTQIKIAGDDSGFQFPDEQKLLALIETKRVPRTTAYEETSRLAYLLRPDSLKLADSAKAAEEDAHTVVFEAIQQVGGVFTTVPAQTAVAADGQKTEVGELYLNVFAEKKIVVWLRTSQPNASQSKFYTFVRDEVLPVQFPGYTVYVTTHGDVPSKNPSVNVRARDMWTAVTGHVGAYARLESLFTY
jgi:hypothetical protein